MKNGDHDGNKSESGPGFSIVGMCLNSYAPGGERDEIALRIKSSAGVETSLLSPRFCFDDPDQTSIGPHVRP